MNDVDRRLRDAGARLRNTAPSAEATAAALSRLGDVQLDDGRSGGRRRMWIVAPAVLAAAAAVIGVIVMTRPDPQAVVPADTTVVPTTTVRATTTTSTVAGVDLGFGVTFETTDENFDGDGGACLTLSTSTDSASGCASGATMRAAFGSPLLLRLDGTPYTLFPAGVDGAGPPLLTDSAVPACFVSADVPGALVENAGCTADGLGIVGALPATPEGTVTWTAIGSASDALHLLVSAADLRTRVFRSESCVIVAAGDVREACGTPGTFVRLAGSADAPLVVTFDSDAGTATLDPLDPATTLDINDCAELTAGELVALLPEHGTAGALLCGGDVGTVWVPPVLVNPRFVETSWDIIGRVDETWSVTASGLDYTCTDGIAADACTTLGVLDLAQAPQFPSVGSIAGFDAAVGDGSPLPSRPVIEELPAVSPVAALPALAEAFLTELRAASEDPDQTFEVFSDSSPIVIRRTNLDDSVTATVLVLDTGTFQGGVVVVSQGTRAVDICGRGTTTLDGATVCL